MAAEVSASPDGEDLIRSSYQSLVDSYGQYHGDGAQGCETRPLAGFAARLPQAKKASGGPLAGRQGLPSCASNGRPAGDRGICGEDGAGDGRPARQRTNKIQVGNPRAAQRAEKAGSAGARAAADTDSVDAGGPVPKAFASIGAFGGAHSGMLTEASGRSAARPARGPSSSAAPPPAACAASADATDEAEVGEAACSPEERRQWAQYYRQCADALEQHESAAAQGCNTDALPVGSHEAAAPAPWSSMPGAPQGAGAARAHWPPQAAVSPAVAPAVGVPAFGHLGHGAGIGAAGAAGGLGLNNLSILAAIGHLHLSGLLTQPAASSAALGGLGLGAQSLLQPGGHIAGLGSLGGLAAGFGGAVPGIPGLGLGGAQQVPGLAELSAAAGGQVVGDGAEDALVNLLMAWYHSGYYTGQYAARQGR